MNYSIKNDFYTISVSSRGAELCSIKTSDGTELLWQNEPECWNSHAPILFPTCGKLKDAKYVYGGREYPMGGHGFASKSEFELLSAEGSHITMKLSSNQKTKEIYPFDFTVIADYELCGEEIKFTFTVKNDGKDVLPYMFGWHPGFILPAGKGREINDYKLYFGDFDKLEWHPLQHGVFVCPDGRDYALKGGAYQLSEEEIYKNDTMIFLGHGNEVKLFAEGYPFMLSMSWSDNLPVLCIWKDTEPSARFICIEPWSSSPNDGVCDENFETRKMARLSAGMSEKYSYSLNFKTK